MADRWRVTDVRNGSAAVTQRLPRERPLSSRGRREFVQIWRNIYRRLSLVNHRRANAVRALFLTGGWTWSILRTPCMSYLRHRQHALRGDAVHDLTQLLDEPEFITIHKQIELRYLDL